MAAQVVVLDFIPVRGDSSAVVVFSVCYAMSSLTLLMILLINLAYVSMLLILALPGPGVFCFYSFKCKQYILQYISFLFRQKSFNLPESGFCCLQLRTLINSEN